MKFSHFLSLVVAAASLIVGGVHLSRVNPSSSAGSAANGGNKPPEHHFIAAGGGDPDRITCAMKVDPESTDVWPSEIQACWPTEGWTQPHPWGSWAIGPASRIDVDLDTTTARTLVIRTRANRALGKNKEQSVTLRVNGHRIGAHPVPREWTSVEFSIPEETLQVGRNTFSLKFAHGITPRRAGRGKGHMHMAAEVSNFDLRVSPGRHTDTDRRSSGANVWEKNHRVFLINEPGVLVLPLYVPAGTDRIEFDLRSTTSIDSQPRSAIITLEDLDGGIDHQSEIRISPGESLKTARLPARRTVGIWSLLTIDFSIDTGNVEVSEIRFVPGTGSGSKRATGSSPETPPGGPPDLIWITLDAARADRFSFGGHGRETTPFIDGLARESHIFPNAYSLVPYTLGSVPTMITGLSFLDHGVVRHEHVLHEDAVTLAESLQGAGYLTAAFSATPNNSKAKGFDQGYEIFREVWTEFPKREARRAGLIAKLVTDWLESIVDDPRPIHLQVHIIPPHAPYDPETRFDRFTDPAYDGPCTGYPRTLISIDGGSMEPTAECLEHLFALYDGNLRAADDAVRIIVEALRERPRWKNTVVLITSDHGEAFMEHGRMEHNSTLFSEMLHVPFVLRMPPDYEGPAIDTERLVTLADIKPTLLGAAGLKSHRTMDSFNLLEAGAVPESRFMVGQTATNPPLQAIRTLRWNMMINAAGSGALFDLTADPSENINRRSQDPSRYAGLGMILATRIGMPSQLVVSDGTADITEDERALLESLGYLR